MLTLLVIVVRICSVDVDDGVAKSLDNSEQAVEVLFNSSVSGKSKNKYKHFTSVEGNEVDAIIGTNVLLPLQAKRFKVDKSTQPRLSWQA
jgi:hypothetical protein